MKNKKIFIWLLTSGVLFPSVGELQAELDIDPAIKLSNYERPEIQISEIEISFNEETAKLWKKALNRPEADYQRLAATSIILAHRRGIEGMEAAIPDLVTLLQKKDLHPTVKLSLVEALVELEAQDQAELLAGIAQAESIYFQLKIEPALARWKYEPYQSVWLERIKGEEYRRRAFGLALECLTLTQVEEAIPRMIEIARSNEIPDSARITASKCLGTLKSDGLLEEAKALTESGGFINEYIAVNIIRNHSGEECENLLRTLGKSSEPMVAKVALARLIENEELTLSQVAGSAVSSLDPPLRKLGVQALNRFHSDEKVSQLLNLLSDENVQVRRQVKAVLLDYAEKEEFKESIVNSCREKLDSPDWRELEQAILILAELDDKQSATKILPHLKHKRPEVIVSASWAMRMLKVYTTLPGLAEYLVGLTSRSAEEIMALTRNDRRAVELATSQLILLIGELKFVAPEKELKSLITAKIFGDETRAAAIWALGEINEGKQPEDLVNKLIARVIDTVGDNPEDERIRRMSAISLGKMKATKAIPDLEYYYKEGKPSFSTADWACGWALEQITGEKVAPVGKIPLSWDDWFLKPAPEKLK